MLHPFATRARPARAQTGTRVPAHVRGGARAHTRVREHIFSRPRSRHCRLPAAAAHCSAPWPGARPPAHRRPRQARAPPPPAQCRASLPGPPRGMRPHPSKKPTTVCARGARRSRAAATRGARVARESHPRGPSPRGACGRYLSLPSVLPVALASPLGLHPPAQVGLLCACLRG